MSKKKPYRLIDEIGVPLDSRMLGVYDQIVDDFLESASSLVSVEIDGREPHAVYQGLRNCIDRRKLGAKLNRFIRGDKVYLEKIIIS